jgi:peptidoglycan glycosyltransferase
VNRQVRRLAIFLMVLYVGLYVQLNITSVVRADEYRNDPANTRGLQADFSQPRGLIVTSDGVVVARSVEVDDELERLREYPEGDLYAHTAGFLSLEYGAAGLEQELNGVLSGESRDVAFRSLSDLIFDRNRTADVTMTLRHSVQEVARQSLGDRNGSVVALDPRTGAILAMWSYPSYEPAQLSSHDLAAVTAYRESLFEGDPECRSCPLLGKAYQAVFAPGSTFKVVTGTAGLESGQVTRDSPVYPVVTEYVPPQTDQPIQNFGGAACGGNIAEALARSCNTSFAQMAVDIGGQQMSDTSVAYGFNRDIPIDLPDPAVSTFPDAEFFEDNQPLLAQSGIGQFEVAATPLQMAMVAGAVANQGIVMAPYVVEGIRDSDGRVVRTTDPRAFSSAMSLATSETMNDLMVGVVTGGTGGSVAIPGVTVGAKTGTAEITEDSDDTHAWMIAFAPAEAPTVAVAVIVEGALETGTQTGGGVAGPIARSVLEAALSSTAAPA